jgi:membrane protein
VASKGAALIASDNPIADQPLKRPETRIWELVSAFPLKSLWHVHGVPVRKLARRIWDSIIEDRLFGHAAELAFYFLFALFPTLLCVGAVLGIAARSAHQLYAHLIDYMALVIPTAALGAVVSTFNETTTAASSGKVTIGLIVAVWSASAGISAIQDTLNAVYKIVDSRSFFWARICAISLTFFMTIIVSLGLASLLGADYAAHVIRHHISDPALRVAGETAAKCAGWILASGFVVLSFSVIYYWAPDTRARRWHWLTPGGVVGILGWVLASLSLRLYLHFFNSYTLTYGSLGAVIILLMWFYITGLMILIGAEINSEIEAAAAELRLSEKPSRESA